MKVSLLICLLLVCSQAQMLRSHNDHIIEEIKFNAILSNEFEIVIPKLSENSLKQCQSIILNDNQICQIKSVYNTTVVCSYPIYQLQTESQITIPQSCRTVCQGKPGCSLLQMGDYYNSLLQQDQSVRSLEEVDPFSFSPASGSFICPSYLRIDLLSLNKKISKVFLQKNQIQSEIIILFQNVKILDCLLKDNLKSGEYNIVLQTEDSVQIISKAIFKIQVTVTSVTPSQGSIDGGVILTINGDYFSLRDIDNKVKISNVDCLIISSKKTEIQCITQKASAPLPTLQQKYDVIVYSGDQESVAAESGQYSFIQIDLKPSITSIGSNIKGKMIQGETIVITGENLQIEGQETILRIGDFQQEYDTLTPNQLNFTVPFDFPNFKQLLRIHVGENGATEQQEVVAPVMMLESVSLNKPIFRSYVQNEYYEFLYFDLKLSNYDTTYSFIVTFDNINSFQAQVDQSFYNKNSVFVRVLKDNYRIGYNQITSIKIAGDEILLTTPLTINNILRNDKYNVFKSIGASQISQEATYFIITYEPLDVDLEVYQVQIRTSNYGQQFLGTIGDKSFSFNKIPRINDFSYSFIIEGSSNKGTFSVQVQSNEFIFTQTQETITIIDNPFINGSIYPGLTFKVQFQKFLPISDFLCLQCEGFNYPLFSETAYNTENVYEFTIPVVFNNSGGSVTGMQQCSIQHRSQWTKEGDQYTTPNILFENNLNLIQAFINQYTCLESIYPINVAYNFQNDIIINSIAPQNISYIGDQIVEMRGTNLLDVSVDQVSVKFNGVDCKVIEASSQVIKCLTQFQEKIQFLEQPSIVVFIKEIKVNVKTSLMNMVFRQIDPLPFYGFLDFYQPNSKVFIPKFYTLLMDDISIMDKKAVSYDRVLVEGSLQFLTTVSYDITLNRLLGQGSIFVGTENQSFDANTFKLTVNEETNIGNVSAYSNQKQIFLKLTESALKNQNVLKLSNSDIIKANLQVGDELIITGTTLDTQSEHVNIATIGTNQLTLTNNLVFDHICASETIKTKDGTTIDFKVNPTVTKINKRVLLILANLEKQYKELINYQPDNRIFILQGVNIQLNQARTSTNYNYYLSALDSYLRITIQNMEQQNCANLQKFENNIIENQEQGCYMHTQNLLSIKNNLFISSSQSSFNFYGYQGTSFIDNTFQSAQFLIQNYGNSQNEQQLTLQGNTFYNTQICLQIYSNYQIYTPIIMENNNCFSCVNALSINQYTSIKSSNFYFVAIDIKEAALLDNYEAYSQTDDYSSQYQVQGRAVFQSKLSLSTIERTPLTYKKIYDNSEPWLLNQNYYANIEFIGFNYSSTQKLTDSNVSNVSNVWRIVSFKNIKQDFNIKSILLPDNNNLIIKDIDGSFSGIAKPSNIFSNFHNLHDDSASCLNKDQYSICQNSLAHFANFYQWHLYQNDQNTLELNRSNNKIIQGTKNGFFVVLGETYKATIKDSSSARAIFQMSSLNLDYSQDYTKGIIIQYTLGDDYLSYQVINLKIYSLKELLFQSQQSQFYSESSSDITLSTCNHGDYFMNEPNLSVCYRALNPITIIASYYPEVYPLVTKLSPLTKQRDFLNENDWKDFNKSYKTLKRCTILSNWKMVISKSGVYDIPSLVIQGSLTIVGDGDITINVRGIYIGAGTFTVSSSFTGKLKINFVSTNNPSEIIFNNPYESATFEEGYFVVNNNLTIENSMNNLPIFRIKGTYDKMQTNIIVDGLTTNSQIAVGDEVFIVSPRTGEQLTTTIVSIRKYDKTSTLLNIKDALTFTFTEFDNLQAGVKNIVLTPYLKVFKRRIQINNAKIVTLSHGLNYIPQVSLKGVIFENSIITTKKAISKVSIQDSIFLPGQVTQVSYFSNENTIINYSSNFGSKILNPQFLLTNNIFYQAKNPIKINQFNNYYISSIEEQFTKIDENSNISMTLNFAKNIIIDSEVGFYSFYVSNLSDNIIIKSSNVCSNSGQCQIHQNDQLYLCTLSGISYTKCDTVKNLLVAFSGTFFQGMVRQIQNVVSVANQVHFKPFAGTYDKNTPLNVYEVFVSQSVVISDLVKKENIASCTTSKAIQIFTPTDNFIQVPRITIKDSVFSNFICSKGITFPTNTPTDQIYHSSVAFINTSCLNCIFNNLNDMIDTTSQVPLSFLVQDYQGVFLGNPSATTKNQKSYVFTSQVDTPFINVQNQLNTLGRLFIRNLNEKNVNDFSLSENTYNTQKIETNQGVISVFSLNQIYSLVSTNFAQIAIRMSSHNFQTTEYIQLRLKVGKEKGLQIQQNTQLLLPASGLDTSNGYDIMKMVKSQPSQIKCGVNFYDPTLDEYHLILTNDNGCIIHIYEYSTAKVNIVIPTPILPPPPPEEQNMCLAQRQMLYAINKISQLLGIDKRRIKVLSQSNLNSCKLNRILIETQDGTTEALSFTLSIEPEVINSCTQDTNCSADDKKAQEVVVQQSNISTFQSLQTLQQKAMESGFVISDVQASLPNIVSNCNNQFYQDGKCVDACDPNYYLKDSTICIKCHVACKTCSASTSLDCKQIVGQNKLDCAADYSTFINADNTNYCGKCPSNCKSLCTDLKSPQCPASQCQSGFVNQNGYCTKSCASNFFNQNDEGVCNKCLSYCKDGCQNGTCLCQTGFFFKRYKDDVCAPCYEGCATCASENTCEACISDKFDPKMLCQVEFEVPTKQAGSQFGLIVGLTIGIVGALFIGSFGIYQYIKCKRQNKYTHKIPNSELNVQQDQEVVSNQYTESQLVK